VAHARTYSDIQSLSFGDRITVDFPEPPAEVARLKVPRLVLQPLLENAYEHALEHRTVGAELHVSYMERGSRLDILVEDNGERISDDEISELNRKLRDSEHAPVTEREHRTGLANVHRRVLLRYGPGYGVELSRSAHGGLRVRLSIPIPSARDEPHDENTGS
jgi:two-component system sensor histidine kinase YesM